MRRQGGGNCEILVANLAREGPFPRVGPLMDFEVAQMSEPLLADFAIKRTFSSVQTQMGVELGLPVERLCASFALEVLLSVLHLLSVR